jgi:photosystem II stability/assembly factor-like uncharacterized protein
MKRQITRLSVVCLVLCVFCYIAQGQSMINPLDIPKPDREMPSWAKLLYVTPLNVLNVKNAFDKYYETHELPAEGITEKTKNDKEENEAELKYVLYFYRLIMFTKGGLNEDGTIKEVLEQNDTGNKKVMEKGATERAAIWTALNSETYWSTNDRPGNAMVDEHSNIYCFDVFPANTSIAYAGAETGGLFKTIDKGMNWVEISMDKKFGNPTAIAIDPTNSDGVLVGNPNTIYKTTDGGITWVTVLNVSGLGLNAIEISPLNPAVALAATNKGIYRSTDKGSTWTNIVTSASTDIAINPKDANIVYTVLKNTGTNFYECWKSTDQGQTFVKKSTGWATGYTGGEAVIGLTQADPNRVYISLLTNKQPILEKSTDGGDNWTTVAVGSSTSFPMDGGQGFYDFVILVSPTNADHLVVGTSSIYKSTDGGSTFKCLSGYCGEPLRVHVDQQAAKAIGNESWISSDGGITYSTDFYTATSFSRIKGINAGSWWGMGTAWNRDIIVGGLYHEGDLGYSEMYNGKTVRMGGGESPTGYINPFYDQNTYCDDIGGWKLPTVLSNKIVSIPNLSIYPNQSYAEMESSEVEWDPRCAQIMYLGKDNKFYKSTNNGAAFTALLTSSDAGAKIMQFEISRNNPDVMYVVQRDNTTGKIWKTTNAGVTWAPVSAIPGTSNNEKSHMTITMSAVNDNELWVGLKDGGAANKVFKSTDGGTTWVNMTTPTIGSLYILSIMHQMGTDGGVYVGGTDGKMYYRNNKLTDWQPYFAGLPVHYGAAFLKPFYRDNKIRTGGEGGLWEAALYEPSSPVAQPMVDKLTGKSCPADTFYFDSYSVLSLTGATFSWSFPGASYVSSTTVRNPKVIYTAGTHSVTLTVTNPNGTNTKTLANLVTVTAGTNTPAAPTITQSGFVLTSSSATGNQWCLNGVPIPGATNQNYTATAIGNYSVVLIKGGCPSAASNVISINTVGVEEMDNLNQLSVYPNPGHEDFTVAFNSAERTTYTLEIENMLGQVIYKEEIKDFKGDYSKALNISKGVSGIYTLRLSGTHNQTVQKIIAY